ECEAYTKIRGRSTPPFREKKSKHEIRNPKEPRPSRSGARDAVRPVRLLFEFRASDFVLSARARTGGRGVLSLKYSPAAFARRKSPTCCRSARPARHPPGRPVTPQPPY